MRGYLCVFVAGLVLSSGCGDDDDGAAEAGTGTDVFVGQDVSVADTGDDTASADTATDTDELPGCPNGALTIEPAVPYTSDALQAVLEPARDDVVYGWYDLTDGGANALVQGFSLPSAQTVKNHRYEVRVASTTRAECPVLTASVTVNNAPPAVSQVVVTPSAAYVDDTLTCAPLPNGLSDLDGDPVGSTFEWLVNGTTLTGQTAETLSGVFTPGDRVVCRLTPNDGETDGLPVDSPEVLILDEPPSTTQVSVICDSVDAVTCTAQGVDPEGGPLQFRFEWHLGDAGCDANPYFTEVAAGDIGSLLEDTPAKGVNVSCCATAIDSAGLEGTPVQSAACTVPNHPPTVPGADVVSAAPDGVVTVSTSVICDAVVSDVDGDAVTETCTWLIDGEPLAQDPPSCVLQGAFAKGQSVCCQVTANDGEAEVTSLAKTCAEVADSPPEISSITVLPEDGDHCATPTCVATGTDADGEEVAVNISWLVDGEPTAQPDNTTGLPVQCVATPVAAGVAGEPATADLAFGNQVPQLTSVDIASSDTPPNTTSFISCQISGALDLDACDEVTEAITWVVNNEEVATGSVLSSELFSKGDTVVCVGEVTDGFDSVEGVFSDVFVIGDSPGSVVSVTVSPPVGNHKSIFTCNAETFDADFDDVSLTYTWFVDGVPLEGKTGATVSGVPVSQNPTLLTCAAASFGEVGPLPAVPSVNAAALTNALPVVTSVAISPQAPATSDVLLCSASGTDADGDPVLFTYEWLIELDGATSTVDTGSSGTLASSETTVGQVVRCRATPTDGLFDGSPQTSLPVIIGNSPPTSEGALLTPTGGAPLTTFTCVGTGYADADGSEPAFEYEWTLNGVSVEGASAATWVPSSAGAVVGDTIACTAAPFDGSATGEPKQSNPVVLTACAGADGLPCDDNNACTESDICVAGTCVGTAIDCSDDNPCTTDTCDPVAGCGSSFNSAPCDDGNPCTADDVCALGSCGGSDVNCEDDNSCTTSGCNAETGCVQFPVVGPCDDGDPCTESDFCSAGSCQGGPAIDCDDGNPCTTDFCALNVGCTSTNNDAAPCDDGNPCTAQDYCDSGACLPGTATSCDDANECTADTCSPDVGCTYGPVPIGKVCSDGDPCTDGDQCEGQACAPGPSLDCDDNNECTIDQCAAGVGCVYTDAEGACLDGVGVCLLGTCCVPQCDGLQCGDDGCGGQCGSCALNEACVSGQCIDGGLEDMVLVPEGDFLMGCNPDVELDCVEDEMPQRVVTLDAYLVDIDEVTVGDYTQCVDAGACTEAGDGFKCTIDDGNDDKPVNCVSWSQADGFCAWAGKRLCTEAEWEKAARGVDGDQWPWGSEPVATCLHACLNDGGVGCGSGTVFPVGLFTNAVSPYGIFDAVGNVREWTNDYYMATYYQVGPSVNPTGVPFGISRVARGGGYGDLASKSRPSARDPMSPSSQADQVGIRCCKDFEP